MEKKVKNLFWKMAKRRLYVLLFFNLMLVVLLIQNLQPTATNSVCALLVILNLWFAWYLRHQYSTIIDALKLPSFKVQVNIESHITSTPDAPYEWQTATLILNDEESLKVEIGISSVAWPDKTETFSAIAFFQGHAPKLIVNEELNLLATITAVLEE